MKTNTINTNINFSKNKYTKTFKNGITVNITSKPTLTGQDIYSATVSNPKGKLLHTLKLAEEELKDSHKHLAVIKKLIPAAEGLSGKGIYETCSGTYTEIKRILKSNIKQQVTRLLSA